MKWGLRIRGTLFLVATGSLTYWFLDFNGSVREKLYLLFGASLALIVLAVILEINPLKPFGHPDDENKG